MQVTCELDVAAQELSAENSYNRWWFDVLADSLADVVVLDNVPARESEPKRT
jgi:hypothetical protein